MDEASQVMRLLGGLCLLAPFALGRIPSLRPYARRIGAAILILYIGFGIGFVIWYVLIRTPPGGV